MLDLQGFDLFSCQHTIELRRFPHWHVCDQDGGRQESGQCKKPQPKATVPETFLDIRFDSFQDTAVLRFGRVACPFHRPVVPFTRRGSETRSQVAPEGALDEGV